MAASPHMRHHGRTLQGGVPTCHGCTGQRGLKMKERSKRRNGRTCSVCWPRHGRTMTAHPTATPAVPTAVAPAPGGRIAQHGRRAATTQTSCRCRTYRLQPLPGRLSSSSTPPQPGSGPPHGCTPRLAAPVAPPPGALPADDHTWQGAIGGTEKGE
uniref:Uncharacterized protein n=3 Tax=Oryza TaxID=4527 RepID=Q10KH7_ORYSJ|nr:hypothetical protein LOC_Os03g26670 [Oryza sativa Japonica Group]